MKDEHVKNMAQDVAQGVAEDVLGVAKDGSVNMLSAVYIPIFQRPNPRPTHVYRLALGRRVKDGHVKNVAEDVAQDVAGGVLGIAKDGSANVFITVPIAIF